MSDMVECDSCKKKMYKDSRSEKGAYFDIWVNHERQCHLCRKCFKERLGDIFVDYFDEVDDEQA